MICVEAVYELSTRLEFNRNIMYHLSSLDVPYKQTCILWLINILAYYPFDMIYIGLLNFATFKVAMWL